MAEPAKKPKMVLSEEAKKRKRESDQTRTRTRINIGRTYTWWRKMKEAMGCNTGYFTWSVDMVSKCGFCIHQFRQLSQQIHVYSAAHGKAYAATVYTTLVTVNSCAYQPHGGTVSKCSVVLL